MISFAVFTSIACMVGVGLLLSHVRAHRVTVCSWQELVAKIQPVQSEGVTRVALDHLVPTKNQLELEPADMWELVGGLDGLQRMSENATVLIALAAHAEQWNHDEGVIVAERMRRDGLAVKRAVRSIQVAMFFRVGQVGVPFQLHEAAGSYYLMKQRLLALYETSHAGLYPRLAEAL
ncbi:MAG: hypothetical protein NVSMB3_03350 [Acidobacteriaceae bacterium]